MTKIHFTNGEITIKEHAGNTDVCNAVSILAFTLIDSLQYFQHTGDIDELDIDLHDGYVTIKYDDDSTGSAAVALESMLKTIHRGFELLAEYHPEHIVFI